MTRPHSWTSRQSAAVVVMLIGVSIAAHAGGVKLKLEASARNLFAPARCVIEGTLVGGSSTDPSLQCLTEEWTYSAAYQTFTNQETNRSIRTHPCDGQTQPAEMLRKFSNTFEFYNPGSYSIRLVLRNRDGKIVASNNVSVRVLRPASDIYRSD